MLAEEAEGIGGLDQHEAFTSEHRTSVVLRLLNVTL